MIRWLLTRRPVLLWRGLMTRRDTPDLARLEAETDAASFVWSILPHAARSFAASIVALPRRKANPAAVAYLYCRMLDTYEDLYPDESARGEALLRFGRRLHQSPLQPAEPIDDPLARDDRDRLHLLLVRQCHLVDDMYLRLPTGQQEAIARLLQDMAEGMAWSTATFADQGGVLIGRDQVVQYCHNVIGNPVLFALTVLEGRAPEPEAARDALHVSEMVQLANITRDIEKDLSRGVAYHADLRPFVTGGGNARERVEAVRRVREEFLELAMSRVRSFVRLFEGSAVRRPPATRAAAVMMLSFTELHYRRCLKWAGGDPWWGPPGPISIVLSAGPSLVSTWAARRSIRRIERNFLAAATRLAEERKDRTGTTPNYGPSIGPPPATSPSR